jgi:hypothetical protein
LASGARVDAIKILAFGTVGLALIAVWQTGPSRTRCSSRLRCS